MVIDSLYTLGVFFFPSFSFFRSGCGPADGSHGLEAASVSYIFFGQSLPFLLFETWLLMVVVLLLLLPLLRQIYSNKSYASLTCKGWINSNTCSCGEDIPTEWRRYPYRVEEEKEACWVGARLIMVILLLLLLLLLLFRSWKKQHLFFSFLFFGDKNGVSSIPLSCHILCY